MQADRTAVFDTYFGKQLSFMYAGINATIKKIETGFSCALLLSSYTEILGGLANGTLRDYRAAQKNYEAFLPYLGEKYVALDKHIRIEHQDTLRHLYGAVRSKLVHEFSPRESYFINLTEYPNDDRIGLEVFGNHLNFHLQEYYRDFKKGVEKYRDDLRIDDDIFGKFLRSLSNSALDSRIINRTPKNEPTLDMNKN